ncbi:MAG: galactokinase family protein [Erysipelotrichia bacterium]|nr:galactokinase family protein [Erysipelotrichia bacterium]
MKCEEKFEEIYKHQPQDIAFCPYRICPLGAHSDHQHGKVTGMAINKGIHLAYGPKRNGVVELVSLDFDKRAQFSVDRIPKSKENDWADYLRGATLALTKKYRLSVGLCGVIEGSLPVGGLSSSAAVTLVFLSALCTVNNIHPSKKELIEMSVYAENEYVGVSSGTLDQSCECYCKANSLLYLDTESGEFVNVEPNTNMPPYEIMIVFSGVERTLADSKFNMRVDECKAAGYALEAFSNSEYGKFKDTYLRDVPKEIFLKYKDRLPLNWAKRAEHWYTEFDRVEKGIECWKNGDINGFGNLVFESGKSSIENYETGSPELKKIYDILKNVDGVYGGRFSGAGFKGCCMALINPEYKNKIAQKVQTEYLESFPQYSDKMQIEFCYSVDGIEY